MAAGIQRCGHHVVPLRRMTSVTARQSAHVDVAQVRFKNQQNRANRCGRLMARKEWRRQATMQI